MSAAVGAFVAGVDRVLGGAQGLYPAGVGLAGLDAAMPSPPAAPGFSGTAAGVAGAAQGYRDDWRATGQADMRAAEAATAGGQAALSGGSVAGRVRGAARAQAQAIAPATGSPAGVALLVAAMDDKLAAMQRQLRVTVEQNRLLAIRMRQVALAYRMTGVGGGAGMAPVMGSALGSAGGAVSPVLGGLGASVGGLGQLGAAPASLAAAVAPVGRRGQPGSESAGAQALLGGRRGGSPAALEAVRFARARLGRPYVWGASGPGAFDCSGLVQAAYRSAGIALPRTTYQMIGAGRPVSRGDIRPGDLILSNFSAPGRPEHVQLAISPSMVIEAPAPGGHVQISGVPAGPIAVRRVVR